MAGRTHARRRSAIGVVSVLVAAAVLTDALPAAAAPGRTVSTTTELTGELAAPGASPETIVLGADLTAAPTSGARSANGSDLTIDLAGHDLALGSLEVGTAAALRITDSSATGGTLTVDGAAVDTPIRVPAGTRFTVDGSAHLRASGGKSSAVIGAHGAPDAYGAGAIAFLGRAVVDVQGSTAPGRTSSGVGGPQTSIHIGEHAVVRVVATSAGAGLGGGSGGMGGDSAVLIDGDADVTVRTLGAGAAIGSSSGIPSARVTTVVVRDRARVTASGGPYGPGIGNGGASGTSATVTIEGSAAVTATGGTSAAGIGGGVGYNGVGGNGAAVTIGAGATVTAAGGSGTDNAIGSGSGRAAATFGSLTTAGRLTIPEGAGLRIPAGTTIRNSGTVTTAGAIGGGGAIANSGTIVTTGSGGSLSSSTTVTGDRHALVLDAGGGTPTGPTGLRLTADSIAAGGAATSLPSPPPGQVVVGWNTSADGSGTAVDDTTDLRAVAPPDPSGAAAPLVLHAVFVPTALALPRLPTADPGPATTGRAYRTAFTVTSGLDPVAYRTTAGSLPAGLALDAATGELTGTPAGPGTASVTIAATNRYGTDARRYALRVVDPAPAPTTSASSAPPVATATATAQPTAAPSVVPTDSTPPAPVPTAAALAPTATPTVDPGPLTPAREPAPAAAVAGDPVSAPPSASVPDPLPAATAADRGAAAWTPPRLPATLGRGSLPVGAAVAQPIGTAGAGTAFAVTAGGLPAGLRLDRERAVVTGTPTRPGRYRFTISASSAAGATVRTYALTVVAPLSFRVGSPAGRAVPLVAGSRARVVLAGLLPGERYVVRWAGVVVARGTAHAGRTLRVVRVPDRAGSGTITVRAAEHPGARAARAVRTVRSGAVLTVAAPIGVQANRALVVQVGGLVPGEPVRVRYAGSTVSPEGARADARGRYRLATSAGWSWGWKAIEVQGLPGRTGAARTAVLPRRD